MAERDTIQFEVFTTEAAALAYCEQARLLLIAAGIPTTKYADPIPHRHNAVLAPAEKRWIVKVKPALAQHLPPQGTRLTHAQLVTQDFVRRKDLAFGDPRHYTIDPLYDGVTLAPPKVIF